MTAVIKNHPDDDFGRDMFGFREDWVDGFVTGDRWTPLTADLTSASTQCLVLATTGNERGILSITQDATDNDECYFQMTKLPFKFMAGKPMYCETRLQFTEGNTSGQNIIFGFLSVAPGSMANALIDDGGGPVASASMAVIYKVDGGTVWRCRSQIGAAVGQTDSISNKTAGGSSYQTLRIEVNPYSTTNAEIIYFCDGEQLKTSAGVPIKHDLVYTNAVVMGCCFGQKTGSATAEVLLNDYICARQKR